MKLEKWRLFLIFEIPINVGIYLRYYMPMQLICLFKGHATIVDPSICDRCTMRVNT